MKKTDEQWINGFFTGYQSANTRTLDLLIRIEKELRKTIQQLRKETGYEK